jgi:hypothetical protein
VRTAAISVLTHDKTARERMDDGDGRERLRERGEGEFMR